LFRVVGLARQLACRGDLFVHVVAEVDPSSGEGADLVDDGVHVSAAGKGFGQSPGDLVCVPQSGD